jgi:hypothetical protein
MRENKEQVHEEQVVVWYGGLYHSKLIPLLWQEPGSGHKHSHSEQECKHEQKNCYKCRFYLTNSHPKEDKEVRVS